MLAVEEFIAVLFWYELGNDIVSGTDGASFCGSMVRGE